MKKLIIIGLIIPVIFLGGFKQKEKPVLIISPERITNNKVTRIERNYIAGQRINYAIIAKDGFKYDGIRQQVIKRDEKTANWGISIVQTQDLYIDKSQNFYSSYIVLQRPGWYMLQFFYLNNKNYPFASIEFVVN